jgi:hypothetical protein
MWKEKQMIKKSDLENGMIVETRNGNIFLVLKPYLEYEFVLIKSDGYISPTQYDNDLKSIGFEDNIIDEIYYPGLLSFHAIMKQNSVIDLSRCKPDITRKNIFNKKIVLDKLNFIQKQLNELRMLSNE